MNRPVIQIRDLSAFRGMRRALTGVTFDLHAGEFVALLGLNGAGKSTLLETLAGLLAGYGGSCIVQEKELRDYARRDLSRQVSFLPQWQFGPTGFSVRQIVAMGRYPHSAGWTESPEDQRAIDAALEACQCAHVADRGFQTLSGGERQRALLASALAQETKILALDEPSAHADPPLQASLFSLLRDRASQGNLCIAAVHDINLAVAFATRVILLHEGGVVYDGKVDELLASKAFAAVFGPQITVLQDTAGRSFAAYSQRLQA